MDLRYRTADESETIRERVAQLPIGLILFIMMIIALSYYFDGRTSQVKASPGSASQVESRR